MVWKKPRRPSEPRDMPVFTSGLETRLMKCVGENADKVIKYLTNKIGEPTVTDNGAGTTQYSFHEQLTTRKVQPFIPANAFDQSNIFNPFHAPAVETKTIEIMVILHIVTDGVLNDFTFQVRGHR